jgi:beta-lactam-binding protein with PASTA domain
LTDAENSIFEHGYALGTVEGLPPGYTPEGDAIVIEQNPPPGESHPPGTPVDLAVYDPASYPFETCPPEIDG